jgi:hypothetical protein
MLLSLVVEPSYVTAHLLYFLVELIEACC